MALNLASAEMKFRRALMHLETLNSILDSVVAEAQINQARAEKQFDTERRCWRFFAQGIVTFPHSGTVVLGDYLTNLRAALDHLAWQLATDGGLRVPKDPHLVYFPIYSARGKKRRGKRRGWGFRGNEEARLPLVLRGDVTTIERFQPYPRRKHLRPLALLRRFSNDDKHKEVLPIPHNTQAFNRVKLKIAGGKLIRAVPQIKPGMPIGNGTEVLRVWLKPAKAHVDMEGNITSTISLETGDPLYPALWNMQRLVAEILTKFGGQPYAKKTGHLAAPPIGGTD